jgi:hypothetical protein
MDNHIDISERNQALVNSILDDATQNVRFKKITIMIPISVKLLQEDGEELQDCSFHQLQLEDPKKIEHERLQIAMDKAMNDKLFKNVFKRALNVESIMYKNFTSKWEGGNFMITIDVPPLEKDQDIESAILLHKDDVVDQFMGDDDQIKDNLQHGWTVEYDEDEEGNTYNSFEGEGESQYSIVYFETVSIVNKNKRKSKRKGRK